MFSNLETVDPNMNLNQFFHVVLICYAKRNAHNTIHFIVDFFMSTGYNESCLKQKNQHVSHLFLWICIKNYPPLYKSSYVQLYKASHAVFYDLVSIRDMGRFNQHGSISTVRSARFNQHGSISTVQSAPIA